MTLSSIVHQVGAYAVLPEDVREFLADGFTLALTADFDPADTPPSGLVYLDAKPLKIWRAVVKAHFPHAKTSPAPVVLGAHREVAVLDAIKARVSACAENPAVAGFYLQDDYIGNVVALHEQVIDIIAAYAPGKISVIGLGCTLDYWKATGFAPAYAERQHFAEREMLNWTPNADAALLYVYSLGNQPNSDYSMTGLMPYMLGVLEGEGFDLGQHLLIGGPQCWEPRATPTEVQVAAQCEAFAECGASAICAFTWHSFRDGQPELYNTVGLRNGLSAGQSACEALWYQPL